MFIGFFILEPEEYKSLSIFYENFGYLLYLGLEMSLLCGETKSHD